MKNLKLLIIVGLCFACAQTNYRNLREGQKEQDYIESVELVSRYGEFQRKYAAGEGKIKKVALLPVLISVNNSKIKEENQLKGTYLYDKSRLAEIQSDVEKSAIEYLRSRQVDVKSPGELSNTKNGRPLFLNYSDDIMYSSFHEDEKFLEELAKVNNVDAFVLMRVEIKPTGLKEDEKRGGYEIMNEVSAITHVLVPFSHLQKAGGSSGWLDNNDVLTATSTPFVFATSSTNLVGARERLASETEHLLLLQLNKIQTQEKILSEATKVESPD